MEILANEYTEYYIDTEEFGVYDAHYSSLEGALDAVDMLRREGVAGEMFIMRREVEEYQIAECLPDDE